jgi:molecular chaperone GrpE
VTAKKGNGGSHDDGATLANEAVSETGLAPVEAPPPTHEELAALRQERDELRDQLLRRRADFENFKKRVDRDREHARQEALADVFLALIPILDNFDRALATAAPDGSLREGIELIRRQILAALEASGVVAKDPTGEAFDPEIHQALSHEAVAGYADGTIVEVFQKAYFQGGRLLRPALVKVAKGVAASPEEGAVH